MAAGRMTNILLKTSFSITNILAIIFKASKNSSIDV